jgi:hypothetical protein
MKATILAIERWTRRSLACSPRALMAVISGHRTMGSWEASMRPMLTMVRWVVSWVTSAPPASDWTTRTVPWSVR